MPVIDFTKLQLVYALVLDFCDKLHVEIAALELWCCVVTHDFFIFSFEVQNNFSFYFVHNNTTET